MAKNVITGEIFYPDKTAGCKIPLITGTSCGTYQLSTVRFLYGVTGLFAQNTVPPGTIRTNGFFFTVTIHLGQFAQMVKMWIKKFLIDDFKLQ